MWRRLLGQCALALLGSLAALTARAQDVPRQLLLIPDGGHADARVDVTLAEVFAARLPAVSLQRSATPLEDVRLLAGCTEDAADCLPRIAAQVGADALLVHRVEADGTRLSLTLHTQGSTREAAAQIDELEPTVVRLLRTLQLLPPEPPPVELAAVPPVVLEAPPARPRRWPARLGWTLTAVGGGLLGAGLIAGMLSRRDERRYARVSLDDEQAVDDAHALLSSARDEARIANGLLLGGALFTLAGVTTGLWRWARRDRQPTLGVQTTRAGLMIVLRGSWQGGT